MNTIDKHQIENLLNGVHKNPHSILGIHEEGEKLRIRVYNPNSKSVKAKDLDTNKEYQLARVDERGLFECTVDDKGSL